MKSIDNNQRAPCPFCGERQTVSEATTVWIGRKHHQDEQHCRACDQRIVYGFTLGSGRLEELMTGRARYHWSKP